MPVSYEWRGTFANDELNALHAEAFLTRVYSASEWNWMEQVERYSLGWVVARRGDTLVGFANVLWDGSVHAWLQDVMVAETDRHHGIGVELVREARDGATRAGCDYLHVDFDERLAPFYFDACGFVRTSAGLMGLH